MLWSIKGISPKTSWSCWNIGWCHAGCHLVRRLLLLLLLLLLTWWKLFWSCNIVELLLWLCWCHIWTHQSRGAHI
eukprot:UN03425